MARKNNYRATIIRLNAQIETAIAHLTNLNPSVNWQSVIATEAEAKLTPEYCQSQAEAFRLKKEANLRRGLGKGEKPVVIDGRLTTYRQAAKEAGVSVSAIHNRIARARQKELANHGNEEKA